MFTALLTVGVVSAALAPEGRPTPVPRPRYRPQRLAVPSSARREFTAALVGDVLSFTVFGVFAGLASALLTGTFHRSSQPGPWHVGLPSALKPCRPACASTAAAGGCDVAAEL